MSRSTVYTVSLVFLIAALLSLVLFTNLYLPAKVARAHAAECHNQGGRFVQTRASGGICVRDGRVIIIWNLSGQVENP